MAIQSFYFLIFWGVALAIAAVCQMIENKLKKEDHSGIKLVLIIASYIFAWLFDWKFAVELFAYTLFIYAIGRGLANCGARAGKILFAAGVGCSVIFLCIFKYGNSVMDVCGSLFGTESVTFRFVMPLGLSYYTFSGISYLADLKLGKMEKEHKFIDLILFLSFFPKMTAGPITKAYDFLPKIEKYKGFRMNDVTTGIQIFVFGLFKKVVLADHLAVFVDDVFYAPAAYNTPTILLAAVSYSLQIYYDFSGYSDMAIGIAKTFGIALPQNFNLPYMASNVSEFWKRWHISLSSWLQEYVYIPLGGSRAGNVRTYVNLMAVMLISGLWHGNGWTFLTWGALYGVMSCMYRLYKRTVEKEHQSQRKSINILCVLLNFSMVTLFWIFFRADSMQDALAVIKGIFVYQEGISQMYIWSILSIVILVCASLLAYRKMLLKKETTLRGYYPILDLNRFGALVLFFTFIGVTIIFAYFGETSFIYGGF